MCLTLTATAQTLALLRAQVGRTSVVVAHRLSTIRNADKIALVHKGAVVEQVRTRAAVLADTPQWPAWGARAAP